MNLQQIRREDWILGGLALLLVISLAFFPWYHVGLGPYGAIDRSAIESPYAIWGILALLATLVYLADLAVERFSPQTKLPMVGGDRATTRMAILGVIAVLLIIKFLAHVGSFGWGFVICVLAAIGLAVFTLMQRGGAPLGGRLGGGRGGAVGTGGGTGATTGGTTTGGMTGPGTTGAPSTGTPGGGGGAAQPPGSSQPPPPAGP